jgi:hypothetical protein
MDRMTLGVEEAACRILERLGHKLSDAEVDYETFAGMHNFIINHAGTRFRVQFALVAHYGGLGGDVWGTTTNALRSWIALDYGGEVEEMLTPVLWTSEDGQEVLSTSEDEHEVKAA